MHKIDVSVSNARPQITVSAAALTAKGVGLVVEDHLLTLAYSNSGAGRPASTTAGHLRLSQDAVMLAHQTAVSSVASPTDGFTVNPKVTVDDMYGNNPTSTATAQCGSILTNVAYESKGVDWATQAVLFLVNR